MEGYIYLRFHKSYFSHFKIYELTLIKLGGTENVVDREGSYITGEPDKGYYLKIYKISDWRKVEILLKYIFKDYNYNGKGGTEFYDFCIYHKIENEFRNLDIEYEEVDIEDINRKSRNLELEKNFIKKLMENKILRDYKERSVSFMKDKIVMRDYQIEDKIMNWFDTYYKGILNWICGLGKTITSLNISKKYVNNYLLIGLNNLGLFDQWINVICMFYNLPILCICSCNINGYQTTTNKNIIKEWFKKNSKGIVVTSYRSAYKLKDLDIAFDFGILDECHHLCSEKYYDKAGEYSENEIKYGKNTDILSLNMTKQLGLTATMKEIDRNERINYNDNFNEDIFGKIIDEKSILWGIELDHLCDYELSCPGITYEILEEMIMRSNLRGIDKDDYYLFLSAYMSITSILNGDRKKMLIFVNKIIEIQKVYTYINHLLEDNDKFNIDNIYCIDKDTTDTSKILNEFNDLEYGIMINVYKIGEGIDIPSLDSVLIASDMYSKIRIVQSLLRCCRIHKDKNKARFIIPMIYDNDCNFNKEDDLIKIKTYATVKEVIEQMSHSDMNIIDKVKISKVSKSSSNTHVYEISEEIPDLTNKFKMKIIKRFNIGKRIQMHTMKKNIKILGGRKDNNLGYLQDYRDNKQGKMCLPDLEFLDGKYDKKGYLESNDYTWLDLYSVDVSDYPTWLEFHEKYYNTDQDDYVRLTNESSKLPKIHDLSDIYEKYVDADFWNNSNNEF